MQYLMGGREALLKLYSDQPVDPKTSAKAWVRLHREGLADEALASLLVCVHMPLEVMPEA